MQASAGATDGELARAIASRGGASAEAAEGELYRRYAPRVRLYGLRHLRDEDAARDLAQQVMLTAIEKLRDGSVRDADQIGSFILGTSRTMCIDWRRRERRRERLRDVFIGTADVAVPAELPLDLDRLQACLAGLAERERAIVVMTFYAERTAGDIGRELGVSEGNVRVIRYRAIDRLRKCLTAVPS
jgi:RNA polymerase sigma-70 factor (ECF subfamily)